MANFTPTPGARVLGRERHQFWSPCSSMQCVFWMHRAVLRWAKALIRSVKNCVCGYSPMLEATATCQQRDVPHMRGVTHCRPPRSGSRLRKSAATTKNGRRWWGQNWFQFLCPLTSISVFFSTMTESERAEKGKAAFFAVMSRCDASVSSIDSSFFMITCMSNNIIS